MQFYIKQHKHYCGIDLHEKPMYLCILDSTGQVKFHKNITTSPDALMQAIRPYLDDLIIAVECMFSWYGVADFCEDNNIKFILGHALYMKAIHGGKAKMIKLIHIKLQVLQEVEHYSKVPLFKGLIMIEFVKI